jgi:hypothetical protein
MRKSKNIITQTKPVFAFIVDGECEIWYLQMLKRNEKTLKVDIKPEIPQKKKLSEQYKMVTEYSKHYDKVFWIIDFDEITKETNEAKKGAKTKLQEFKEYYNKIQKKYSNVLVIINNPCLEYWFLMHFEVTSKYYETGDKVIKQLKKYQPLENYEKTEFYYKKTNNDIYLKLKPYLSEAIKNSNQLGDFDFNNHKTAMTQMQFIFPL